MLHSYNTFLNLFNISCLFSSAIIISSANLDFIRFLNIIFVWLSYFVCNLISYKSICFIDHFLEAVFTASSPVSNNCFLYYLANDKIPYLLTYFLVLGWIEYWVISIINKQCQINFIFYFQWSAVLIRKCYNNLIKFCSISFQKH